MLVSIPTIGMSIGGDKWLERWCVDGEELFDGDGVHTVESREWMAVVSRGFWQISAISVAK